MDLTVEKFKIGGVPIDVADKQSRENIVAILKAISSLESSLTGLQGSITNIQNDIAGLNAITDTMQDDISSTQGNVSSLQTSVSNLSSTVSSLQSSVNTLSENVSNLDTNKANNTDFNTQYIAISGTVIDGYACNRKGNISLELGGKSLKSTLNANTWANLLTLPSKYRPISQVYRTFYFAGVYPVIIEINTNGVVKGYSVTTLNAGVTCYDGTEFI